MTQGTTNPARRLHALLSRAQPRKQGEKARDLLAPLFGVDPHDHVALRRGLILVDDLFQETIERITSLEGVDHDTFLRHIPKMREGLANLHLDSSAQSSLSQILNPIAVGALELCAARLGEAYKEHVISGEDLEGLSTEIDTLFDYIDKAQLDPQLRSICLDLVETLRRAVVEYRIRGVAGLENALEESLGKLMRYYLRHEGDVEKTPFRQVWQVLRRVEGLIARGLTYGPYLPETFQLMIGG